MMNSITCPHNQQEQCSLAVSRTVSCGWSPIISGYCARNRKRASFPLIVGASLLLVALASMQVCADDWPQGLRMAVGGP